MEGLSMVHFLLGLTFVAWTDWQEALDYSRLGQVASLFSLCLPENVFVELQNF